MSEELSQIARARLASGMTIEDARKAVGLSYPPYRAREDNPELFTVGELAKLSKEMNRDGKRIFSEWATSFFEL